MSRPERQSMTSDERAVHWSNAYKRQGVEHASWYQSEPTTSLRLIQAAGVPLSASILDAGGGASTLVDHLLGRGYSDVTVLDIAAEALDQARARLGDAAKRVTWIATDLLAFRPERHFQVWHDRAVFHFLTDPEDRASYVETLAASLAPGGHAIIAAFAIGGPTRCSGLDIVQYDSENLLRELGKGFRLIGETTEEHLTPSGKTQRFAYFHLQRLDCP